MGMCAHYLVTSRTQREAAPENRQRESWAVTPAHTLDYCWFVLLRSRQTGVPQPSAWLYAPRHPG